MTRAVPSSISATTPLSWMAATVPVEPLTKRRPSTARLVWNRIRSPAAYWRAFGPPGTREDGAAELSAGDADHADPVGEVFAVAMGDSEHHNLVDTKVVGVGHSRRGEGVTGRCWGLVVVFPAVGAADGLALGDVAAAVDGQSLLFGGVSLAAVDGQVRRGDRLVVGEASELGGEPAGPDRTALVVIAQAPQDRTGRG